MGIRYVGLYQAVAGAMKDLLVVYNEYQVCRVMLSSSSGNERPGDDLQWVKKDLVVAYNRYQLCAVISSSKGKEGPAGGS